MSISKRSLAVEGYKSTPRPEPTLNQIKAWFTHPDLLEIIEDKRKFKFIFQNNFKITFTMTEIDEQPDRQKYINETITSLLRR